MLVSKMHRKGKCPSSEERDPFVSKEMFIILVFKMGAKECRKGVDSFESKRIEKNIRKSHVSDRSRGFETKTLESREKVCSENEKKGISGSRMFRSRRKGSFESKT